MNGARLADLDELALQVRDINSRSYLLEAISAYRSGAYRSAIISTWIAIATDIISKIRELANQGDANAVTFITALDAAIAAKNLRQLQITENELLNKAKNDFEFLAEHEYTDLERLKEDRNLCAHPAFVGEDLLFQPLPDLVRTHIVHAVVHLLKHQPVQGKSALKRIIDDIERSTYPTDYPNVKKYLEEKYLKRSKTALIRNLVILLVREYLRYDNMDLRGREPELVMSLKAVSEYNVQIYEENMAVILSKEASALNEEQISQIFRLLGSDERCWHWLGAAEQIRVKSILGKMSDQQLAEHDVFSAIGIDELRPFLTEKFEEDGTPEGLTRNKKALIIAGSPRLEFVPLAINLYKNSRSFDQAGVIGTNAILPLAKFFTSAQIGEILEIAQANSQVTAASATPDVLTHLFDDRLDILNQTRDFWIGFINKVRETYGPDGYYACPKLYSKMQERGII